MALYVYNVKNFRDFFRSKTLLTNRKKIKVVN